MALPLYDQYIRLSGDTDISLFALVELIRETYAK
jgi:hypothetical protein